MVPKFLSLLFGILIAAIAGVATVVPRQAALSYPQNPQNDYSCRSLLHPTPVVVIHGLLMTYYTDINLLEAFLKSQGFCTFSFTYGSLPGLPRIGGLRSIADSSREVADFILQVSRLTGSKVDLVGHSEGGFQALYVPKFYPDVAAVVNQVFAIGPPTHGTTVSGVHLLAYLGGHFSRELVGDVFEAAGIGAFDDLQGRGDGQDGPAVRALNTGPITVPWIRYTIVVTREDEIVTPPEKSFINEYGVRNFYIQDYCPQEVLGHLQQPNSPNIRAVLVNTLSGSLAGPAVCASGPSVELSSGQSLPPVEELQSTLLNLVSSQGLLPVKRRKRGTSAISHSLL